MKFRLFDTLNRVRLRRQIARERAILAAAEAHADDATLAARVQARRVAVLEARLPSAQAIAHDAAMRAKASVLA